MSGSKQLAGQYLDAAISLLRRARDEESEHVEAAGQLIADTVLGGGRLFVYGAGHSSLPAQDVVYRAGGLALMNLLRIPGMMGVDVRPATLGSALEQVAGLARTVLENSPAEAGDTLIIISLSGRNPLPVELALTARDRGLTVIGLTSLVYAETTGARHPTGTFLKDHCDVVLDNKIEVGDAELTTEGVSAPFAPASTVITSALMQSVMATAAGEIASRGVDPPMLRSGNVEGGHEWNARVMAEHRDRIFFQH